MAVLSELRLCFLSLCIAILTLAPAAATAQGIILTGVGPVNRAMAGASPAAPRALCA
jgi:hypothetical protein